MIPEAAVDAAARVLWHKELVAAWDKFPASFHAPFLRDARAALEAATPHIRAHVVGELLASGGMNLAKNPLPPQDPMP